MGEEAVAKPLHNSLSFDSSMFSQKREMEWHRDDLHVDEVQEPDYFFRCNYCVKLIADDETVHMLKDRSYCSTTCCDKATGRRIPQTPRCHVPTVLQACLRFAFSWRFAARNRKKWSFKLGHRANAHSNHGTSACS